MTRLLPIPFRFVTRITAIAVVTTVVGFWFLMDRFFTEVELTEQ